MRRLPGRTRTHVQLALAALALLAAGGPTAVLVVALGALAVRAAVVGLPKLHARRRAGPPLGAGAVPIGRTAAGRLVQLPAPALAAHAVILGASGSGKSTTMLTILTTQIGRGMPVVVIDLKGSPALARSLQGAAAGAGRELRIWTIDGGAHWNPLAAGNPTELKDKLIATERFTEPHYQRAAERYLQLAIQALRAARPELPVTLSAVVEILDPSRLRALGEQLPAAAAERLERYTATLGRDQLSAIRGLASRLAVITESHTGAFLEPGPGGAATIDLRSTLLSGSADPAGPVVLFSLNSSSYGRLAAQLGTLVVQDLVNATGARQAAGVPLARATVAIDEFSALHGDHVVSLLARGREAGVGVVLATQELADLERAGRGVADQIIGNTAVKLIHRQDMPGSARLASQLTGSRWELESSYGHRHRPPGLGRLGLRFTADTTHTRPVERPLVEWSRFLRLETGEAIAITKVPTTTVEDTRVIPPATPPAGDAWVAPVTRPRPTVRTPTAAPGQVGPGRWPTVAASNRRANAERQPSPSSPDRQPRRDRAPGRPDAQPPAPGVTR